MTTPAVTVVHTNHNGSAVFAARSFETGEFIEYFAGYVITERTRYSLFLSGQHIEPTGSLKYLNHSCDPNTQFESRNLVALRPIETGEELTINYKTIETELSNPFQCNCGAANCLGWIA